MSWLPTPDTLRNAVPSAELKAWLDNITDDSWLTRQEGSVALRELAGFDVSPATLASLAARTRGGGPPYRVFMGVAKSQWRDLRNWAESRAIYRGNPVPKALDTENITA